MRHILEEGAQLRIPEPDGGLMSPTGEQTSIGGKDQTVGALGMPARPEQGTTFDVPELDAAIKAPAGERAFVRAEGEGNHNVRMRLQTRCKVWPASRHTRTSPRLLPAAQYCPVLLMATAVMASKVEVQTHSRISAPHRLASCISTPCKYTPRSTSRDKSGPRRFPRRTRHSVTRLAGPYP